MGMNTPPPADVPKIATTVSCRFSSQIATLLPRSSPIV
jgi:hypothetical protein